MKAEILGAEAENDLSEAERSWHQARYSLFNLIGLPPETQTYRIQFPDTLVFVEVNINQHTALEGMAAQPLYRSVSRNLAAARWGVREAWSDFLPDLNLNFYRQDFGSGYDFYGFEIGLQIPLWFPLNQRGNIQTAKARQRQFSWDQQAVKLDLKNRIEDAWHGYETSLATIRRYHQTIRRQSEQLLQLILEGYRLGELDILVLLEAQRTYLNSQKRYYDALRDYYRQLIELESFLNTDLVY